MTLFQIDDQNLPATRKSIVIYFSLFAFVAYNCVGVEVPFVHSGGEKLQIEKAQLFAFFLVVFVYLALRMFVIWVSILPDIKADLQNIAGARDVTISKIETGLSEYFASFNQFEERAKENKLPDTTSMQDLHDTARAADTKITVGLGSLREHLGADPDDKKNASASDTTWNRLGEFEKTYRDEMQKISQGIYEFHSDVKTFATHRHLMENADNLLSIFKTTLQIGGKTVDRATQAKWILNNVLDIILPIALCLVAIGYISLWFFYDIDPFECNLPNTTTSPTASVIATDPLKCSN